MRYIRTACLPFQLWVNGTRTVSTEEMIYIPFAQAIAVAVLMFASHVCSNISYWSHQLVCLLTGRTELLFLFNDAIACILRASV